MNINGNSVAVKKRAMDPDLRTDLAALRYKAEKIMKKREELLADNKLLRKQVRRIKMKTLDSLEDLIFDTAKKLRALGHNVFLARKPIDVAEYIRGAMGRGRLGIVPSPQTMEAEVMQAFFMSNKVQVLSGRYSGYEKGLSFIHPYFPYPQEEGKMPKIEAENAVVSALAVTDKGGVYLEREEEMIFNKFKEPFIIATVDRVFPERDAEKVIHLMGMASGGAIEGRRVNLKGRLILLDNGRLALARSPLKDILMCINCYSCSLHCPVYLTVGGMFGSPTMSGIGSLSVGYQSGIKAAVNRGLFLCTLCGKCEKVCPTDVPIVELIMRMRRKAKASGI